jgi:hypothetical protein
MQSEKFMSSPAKKAEIFHTGPDDISDDLPHLDRKGNKVYYPACLKYGILEMC